MASSQQWTIKGQRGRNEHLTAREKADLHADIRKNFSMKYCCQQYRISQRVYYMHRNLVRNAP